MAMEGGCYCGDVRYEAGGDALFKGQCHCRECQYVSGGGPNFLMGMPEAMPSCLTDPRRLRTFGKGCDDPGERSFNNVLVGGIARSH